MTEPCKATSCLTMLKFADFWHGSRRINPSTVPRYTMQIFQMLKRESDVSCINTRNIKFEHIVEKILSKNVHILVNLKKGVMIRVVDKFSFGCKNFNNQFSYICATCLCAQVRILSAYGSAEKRVYIKRLFLVQIQETVVQRYEKFEI